MNCMHRNLRIVSFDKNERVSEVSVSIHLIICSCYSIEDLQTGVAYIGPILLFRFTNVRKMLYSQTNLNSFLFSYHRSKNEGR